jgi:hypothetical protein
MWTRRDFSSWLLGAFAASWLPLHASAAPSTRPLFVERVLGRFPAPRLQREIVYRADVTIQILRVPLYRKRGVGGAIANLREYQTEKESAFGISFLAGSNPDQAGGVNRFGYIEEVVVEEASVPAEAAYFGVMTSSPESDFQAARSALGESARDRAYYAAIDGYLKASKSISTEAGFVSSGKYTWLGHPPLSDLMKQALADQSSKVKENSLANPRWEIPITFLYAISKALRQPAGKQTTNYIYHGQEFELETSREPDPKRGEEFAAAGLVKDPSRVLRLDGRSKHLATNSRSAFSIWQDSTDPNGLPLRFEFQPKSFLKLTFERDPSMRVPAQATQARS